MHALNAAANSNVPLPTPTQDPTVQTKYGFLYSNYTTAHPYWETTEMLRKFIFAFIPVRALLALVGGGGRQRQRAGRVGQPSFVWT